MADFALTSSAVIASASGLASVFDGMTAAGVTVVAGQPCYVKASDGLIYLADSNASLEAATVKGVALNGASPGQPVRLCTADADFTHGLTGVTKGDLIILSATAGGLAPTTDYASGMFLTLVMVAISSTKAVLGVPTGTFAANSVAK